MNFFIYKKNGGRERERERYGKSSMIVD